MPMSIRLVALKAAELDPKIAECNTKARYEAARRFVIKHGYTYWLGTNVSQRSPSETAAEALAFMVNVVHPKVNERNRNPAFIIIWIKLQSLLPTIPIELLNMLGNLPSPFVNVTMTPKELHLH